MMKKTILLLSCEHASPYIPEDFQNIDLPHSDNPFEKYDPFADELTQNIASLLNCDHFLGNISRQLIDLNKPAHLNHCFSLPLSDEHQQHLLEQYYHPYHNQIFKTIQQHIQHNHQVMHVSVHTFNPEENGIEHNAAIGLLYDPNRHAEKEVVRIWNELLIKRTPYRVRLNYPRSGKSDNLTSLCRKKWKEHDYLGIELECNASLLRDKQLAAELYNNINETICNLLEML